VTVLKGKKRKALTSRGKREENDERNSIRCGVGLELSKHNEDHKKGTLSGAGLHQSVARRQG